MVTLLRKCSCPLLAILLSVGIPATGGEPVEIRGTDVVLNKGGLVRGTLLNSAAHPVAGLTVNVLHEDKLVATSASNEKGEFSVKGLRSGAHTLQVGSIQKSVRLWSTISAPPGAVDNIAIVVDDQTVRGQAGNPPLTNSVSNIAGNGGTLLFIGGAVAVVLGTTLDNDNATPASP